MLLPRPRSRPNERRIFTLDLDEKPGDPQTPVGLWLPLDERRGSRHNRLKLRNSKTGPRTVWLGDEARAIIDALPRWCNVPWLFWSPGYRNQLRTIHSHWYGIRERAGLPRVRLHDLRHTFASHAAMNQETLPMIGRLLGHRNPQSTSRYAHLSDEHVLDAAEQIGTAIARMMAETRPAK